MDFIEKLKGTFEDDIKDLGYELVDIEYKGSKNGKILTFFIRNEDGITVDDCEKVSVFIDEKLDQLDLIKDSYYLEVSSQDLSKPLKTDRDLERNARELLNVKLKDGESFLGYIDEINEDTYVFSLNEQEEIELNKDDIKQIKIEIIF